VGKKGSKKGLTKAVQARVRSGVQERARVPLEALAEVDDGKDRPDPISLLTEQDRTRVQSLVPIRHERMAATPFTSFRGAAAIMASDLSRTPTTGLRAQLCGDAHLSNFGVFNGADKRLVFDVNDFDETSPGPFEWDLKRLAASVTIAGRGNDLSTKKTRAATKAATHGYREVLTRTLTRSPLELRYFRIDVQSLLDQDEKLRKRSTKAVDKASRKDSMRALEKLTRVVDGQRRIVSKPPLIVPLSDVVSHVGHFDRDRLKEFFGRYRASLAPDRARVVDQYHIVDMANKVVGVGSVGTRCLIVLLQSDQGAPLFLQFKEATKSVLEQYAGPCGYKLAGERVVRGQQLMQSTGDILLGWSRADPDRRGRVIDFYFRQLWDGKGSVEVDQMGPKRLARYAWHCGAALALAHARTGDGAAIYGYLGDESTADEVLADFAERYANLNDRDYAAHQDAIASGVISAASGA
jgi:uncharacterized protein (DUF2252 family)